MRGLTGTRGLPAVEIQNLFAVNVFGGRARKGLAMAGFLSNAEIATLVQGAAVQQLAIAGGVAGNHAVAGIAVGDRLASVLSLDVAQADHAVHGHDITTVAPAGAGTALTEPVIAGPFEAAGGGQVNPGVVDALAAAQAHVRAWAVADLTAEFAITGAGIINNAGGTNTTGVILLVVWEDWT